MARRLVVEIVGDSKSLERAFARSNKSAKNFNQDMTRRMSASVRVTRSLTGALTGLGAGFVGLAGAGLLIREAFGEMAQAQKVSAQTAAVLKSTGGAAGVTATEIELLSEQLMQLSGADDEAVQAGANMIATFTGVRNEVGRGNDIFTQATKAALDMSFALGTDMTSAAKQLGKALNDPVRGITALRRSGVQFTRAQEKQIKAWVESGQIVRAQKAILREVNVEFGNSARAAGDTLPGKLNILKESLRNLAGTFAEELSPKITEVVDKLNDWLANPENQRRSIGVIEEAVRKLGDAFGFVADAADAANQVRQERKGLQESLGRFGIFVAGPAEVFGRAKRDIKAGLDILNPLYEEAGEKAAESYSIGFARNQALQEHFGIIRRGLNVEAARRPPRSSQAGPAGQRGITAAQRNQFFDARIARQLDRLQDLSLRKQLSRLREIGAAIKQRLAATTDITRRLNLEDKLLSVLRQQRAVQTEITEQIRAANQALKDRADAIKSAVIDRLQRRQTDVLNKRALREAQEQLRIARYLGSSASVRAAKERVADVRFDQRIAGLERAPATLTATGRFAFAGVVINIHGVTDPAAVANRVEAILKKRRRHTAAQTRPTAAASA